MYIHVVVPLFYVFLVVKYCIAPVTNNECVGVALKVPEIIHIVLSSSTLTILQWHQSTLERGIQQQRTARTEVCSVVALAPQLVPHSF